MESKAKKAAEGLFFLLSVALTRKYYSPTLLKYWRTDIDLKPFILESDWNTYNTVDIWKFWSILCSPYHRYLIHPWTYSESIFSFSRKLKAHSHVKVT